MAEPPTRRSVLEPLEQRLSQARSATGGRVALAEVAFLAQVNVRAEAHAPCELPTRPNTFTRSGDRRVFWLGPDEWLLAGPPGSRDALEALGATWGAVTDVSAQRTVLQVGGSAARELLATVCALDLHPRAFGPGRCAQTAIGGAAVLLAQLDERPTYWLLVRSSFARYLAELLLDAAQEHRSADAPELTRARAGAPPPSALVDAAA